MQINLKSWKANQKSSMPANNRSMKNELKNYIWGKIVTAGRI